MEAIRSVLGCILTPSRRLSQHSAGYTELTDEKGALLEYNYFSDDKMPYMSNNSMTHYNYGSTCRPHPASDEALAQSIVRLLRHAPVNDNELQSGIRSLIGSSAWSRKLVEECLDNIVECVEDGRRYMGDAMCDALDLATDVADDEFDFPRRHAESVDGFIAIVATGILAQMVGPWVLDVLGFGEVEDRVDIVADEESGEEEVSMSASSKIVVGRRGRPGSVAAWWQHEFAPWIPSSGVYEYFRGLGMVKFEAGDEDAYELVSDGEYRY
ncbi:hypothetical protein V8F06_008229 [Rhypophila decipiens]